MKKMLPLLITLFLIYFGIQVIYNFFSSGHDINYELTTEDKKVQIHEVLNLNEGEGNSYLVEVTYNNKVIPFKFFKTYARSEKVIKSANVFTGGGYTCVYITVDVGDVPSDMKCEKDGIVYLYTEIAGKSPDLDRKLSKFPFYSVDSYRGDESDSFKEDQKIIIYPNNLPEKQTIMLKDYKGLYLINRNFTNKVKFIKLYENDIYDIKLDYLVDQYYIVADYNMNHEFNIFNVINLTSGAQYQIKSENYISFNSYIQGSVKDDLYIIDKDSKKQYQINVRRKNISVVGSESQGAKVYNNGSWTTQNINDLIKGNIMFNSEQDTYEGIKYDRVILNGNKNNGTYYLFKQNGDKYDVYSVYTGSNMKTYLFSTSSKDRIFINKGYIYYIDNDNLMLFSTITGKRKVLTHNELKYNSRLNFMIY